MSIEDTLRLRLAEAVCVIESLADQQAMPDDWYEEDLETFKRVLGWPTEPLPHSWYAAEVDRLRELAGES